MENSFLMPINIEYEENSKFFINEGWEAKIYKINVKDGRTIVLKQFNKPLKLDVINNIIQILSLVNGHENIANYLGYSLDKYLTDAEVSEKNENQFILNIYMDYYLQTLFDIQNNLQNLKETYEGWVKENIYKLVKDSLRACLYLENLGMYHTDPFPWNIAVKENKFIFIDTTSIQKNLGSDNIKKAIKELGYCYLSILKGKSMRRFDFPKENKARKIISDEIEYKDLAVLIISMISKRGNCEKVFNFTEIKDKFPIFFE